MVERYLFRYRRPFRVYASDDDADEVVIRATTPLSAMDKWDLLVKSMHWNDKYGDCVDLLSFTPQNNTEHANS